MNSSKIFSLTTFRRFKPLTKIGHLTYPTAHFSLLRFALPFKKLSNLELIPGSGIKYVRSSGCAARVIKIDKIRYIALIKFPSGVRKFFSIFSLAILQPASLKLKRKIKNTKSGFWRNYGVKPHVRGVARNPVDHPHGGRTKSIKYPRTPWGKTTKFK